MEDKQNDKRFPGWILGLLLMILLAGATFIGGRLIGNRQEMTASKNEIEIIAPDVVPKTEPELKGIIVSIVAENLVVQESAVNTRVDSKQDTIEVNTSISISGSGKNQTSGGPVDEGFPELEGPITEVVVTQDTQIYKDITQPVEIKPGEQVSIEMNLVPGNINEIGEHFFVTVWGERRGDRVIADFILFRFIAFSGE